MWCTSTKQRTSRISLFWDMSNWSWYRSKKWLIFYDITSMLLSTDVQIFSYQKFCISATYYIQNWRIGIMKDQFLKITLLETTFKVFYTNCQNSKIKKGVNFFLVSNSSCKCVCYNVTKKSFYTMLLILCFVGVQNKCPARKSPFPVFSTW